MSRRNSRASKDARKLARDSDARRREEIRRDVMDRLDERLHNEVRKLTNEYNARLLISTLPELKAEYKRRVEEGSNVPLMALRSRATKKQWIDALTYTLDMEEATIARVKANLPKEIEK